MAHRKERQHEREAGEDQKLSTRGKKEEEGKKLIHKNAVQEFLLLG